MKCPICHGEMIYIKDAKMEELGWIAMDCSECKGDFLVPVDNPDLLKEEQINC